jgi:phosphoglycolate phosphatase
VPDPSLSPGSRSSAGTRGPLVVGFDLDMTLADSSIGIAETLRVSLAEAGVAVTAEQTWPLVGIPLLETVIALAPDVDAEAVAARYRELYATTGIPVTTPLPGAQAAIDAVHAQGGCVVVVSAKPAHLVQGVLDRLGLQVEAVTGGLFGADKGMALLELGAAVYVGDHPGDVAAARVARALAVGVATGPHDAAALVAAGADVVLADLRGFPQWLTAWWDAAPRAASGVGSGS